jgi:membrane fusion protein (multidrug efflux system)
MNFGSREDIETRIRLLREQESQLRREISMLGGEEAEKHESHGAFFDQRADQEPLPSPKVSTIKRRPSSLRRASGAFAFAAIAAALAVAGFRAWNYLDSYEATDDAQVDGHIVPISSRIGGTLAHVYVQDTDFVKAGQLLAEIDPRDNQASLDNARANLAQAIAQVDSARADFNAAVSRVREAKATNAQAQRDAARFELLLNQHIVSGSEYDDKARAAEVDAAAVEADQAGAIASRTVIASREAAVRAAQANLGQALLNLGYTQIIAPIGGVIGEKTVELGQHVEPSQQLLAIVPFDDIWITANFKETQIRRIKPGQRATIYVDATGREYEGSVEGLGGASGQKYSLIPAENATGNYVKVVQRLPVRIRLASGQNNDHRLRPGMSVEPKVWLR